MRISGLQVAMVALSVLIAGELALSRGPALIPPAPADAAAPRTSAPWPNDALPVATISADPVRQERIATLINQVYHQLYDSGFASGGQNGDASLVYCAPAYWDLKRYCTAEEFAGVRAWIHVYGDEPLVPFPSNSSFTVHPGMRCCPAGGDQWGHASCKGNGCVSLQGYRP